MASERVSIDSLRVDIDYKPPEGGESVGQALRRLEFQRKERLLLIPTDDEDVKGCLNLLGEPVTKTGEDAVDRRERLADLLFRDEEYMNKFLTSSYASENTKEQEVVQNVSDEENNDDEEFYTPASQELIRARQFLVPYTLDRARKRLKLQREVLDNMDVQKELHYRRNLNIKLSQFELRGSQIVSSRPIAQVVASSNGAYIASGSWGGDVKVLDRDSLDIIKEFNSAHASKVGGLDWDESSRFIVSGAADQLVKLWDTLSDDAEPVALLSGHEGRVARVKFHPSGRFIASASFDMTWRLWDVERQLQLQLQEGHAKEVYCIAFQGDGSLICSAGLDSLGIVWDMRSGKSITTLEGHAKPIYGLDWSPNGYQIATGSADGTIKIWDLRKAGAVSSILAHNDIISEVKFDKTNGSYLVSSSYDKSINLFSADNWKSIATLEGHTDKVLSVDISNDGNHLISSGWDRSVKLWTLDS